MPQHESNAVLLHEMLDPCALRGASTVLRGGRCSNTPSLPDPPDREAQGKPDGTN